MEQQCCFQISNSLQYACDRHDCLCPGQYSSCVHPILVLHKDDAKNEYLEKRGERAVAKKGQAEWFIGRKDQLYTFCAFALLAKKSTQGRGREKTDTSFFRRFPRPKAWPVPNAHHCSSKQYALHQVADDYVLAFRVVMRWLSLQGRRLWDERSECGLRPATLSDR